MLKKNTLLVRQIGYSRLRLQRRNFKFWNVKCNQRNWESVEEMYTSFKEVFDDCRDASVPKRSFKYNDRRTRPPWLNDKMSEIKKSLNKAKRNFKRRSTQQNHDALRTPEEYKVVEEEQKDLWTNNACDKISYSDTPKEMWESLRTLTSYQDLDGGNVLPLLNDDNQPLQYLTYKENVVFCKPHFSVDSSFIIISLTKISKFQWKKNCMRFSMKQSMMTFMTLQPLTKT